MFVSYTVSVHFKNTGKLHEASSFLLLFYFNIFISNFIIIIISLHSRNKELVFSLFMTLVPTETERTCTGWLVVRYSTYCK